jgi:hypothetical protein
MVPVSVHDKSDRAGHNQLSGMFCKLETHIGDPPNDCGRSPGPTPLPRTTVRHQSHAVAGLGASSPIGRVTTTGRGAGCRGGSGC